MPFGVGCVLWVIHQRVPLQHEQSPRCPRDVFMCCKCGISWQRIPEKGKGVLFSFSLRKWLLFSQEQAEPLRRAGPRDLIGHLSSVFVLIHYALKEKSV